MFIVFSQIRESGTRWVMKDILQVGSHDFDFVDNISEENRVVVLGRLSDQIILVNTKKSNALELEDR